MTAYPEWMPTAVAAAYIGRAPITLRKWRVAGSGPPYRIVRNRAVYARSDLDAFMAASEAFTSTADRRVKGASPSVLRTLGDLLRDPTIMSPPSGVAEIEGAIAALRKGLLNPKDWRTARVRMEDALSSLEAALDAIKYGKEKG